MLSPASTTVTKTQHRQGRHDHLGRHRALRPTQQLARAPTSSTSYPSVVDKDDQQLKRRKLNTPPDRQSLLHKADTPAARIFQGGSFPHILDDILSHLPPSDLRTMRTVCRSLYLRVDFLSLKEVRLSCIKKECSQGRTLLGTKLALVNLCLERWQGAPFIRILHTEHLMPHPSAPVLPPLPNLRILHCSMGSQIIPAPMVVHHNRVYPSSLAELPCTFGFSLHNLLDTTGLKHLVCEVAYELDEDMRYARLVPNFTFPESVQRVTIKVRRCNPPNALRRPHGFWCAHGRVGEPVYVLPATPPQPGAFFATREALLRPHDEVPDRRTFFASLARVVADSLNRVAFCIVGAGDWPANWVNSQNEGDDYTFQQKFELAVVDRLEEKYGRSSSPDGWVGPIPNLTFADVDEVEEATIASVLPPAWRE